MIENRGRLQPTIALMMYIMVCGLFLDRSIDRSIEFFTKGDETAMMPNVLLVGQLFPPCAYRLVLYCTVSAFQTLGNYSIGETKIVLLKISTTSLVCSIQ
jgi:hypothetical protein